MLGLVLGLRLRLGLAAAFYPIAGPQVWSAGKHSAFYPWPSRPGVGPASVKYRSSPTPGAVLGKIFEEGLAPHHLGGNNG